MAATKYETVVLPNMTLIGKWARDGATDKEIAKRLGIGFSTFCLYKSKSLELLETLKRGKEIVDAEVENALLKRALGYEYEEITQERKGDNGELVVTKKVKKQVVPDVTAQIYWLKNRVPDKWRDDPAPSNGDGEDAENDAENLREELMKRRVMGFGNGDEV